MLLLLIVIGALSVVGAMAAPLYKPTAAAATAATGKNIYKMMACLFCLPPTGCFTHFPIKRVATFAAAGNVVY